ncbi:hypothetical protein ABZ915_28290 [Streptomyces sp. NPDC046915]|uniref:hypothetical protein n=1 Tax=Streptomyces sp. NPDC046915 TaxID=3155257 RepID=UPI0033C41B85
MNSRTSNDPATISSQLAVKKAKGDAWRKVTTVETPGVGPASRPHGEPPLAASPV